jgi:hypothetical protein
MAPFIVYALPRSRTKWLSRFLTYGGWTCWHDVAVGMRSMADVDRFFARPNTGTAETGAAPGWMLLAQRFPDMRVVVVRRPVDDVLASHVKVLEGYVFDADRLRRNMTYEARMLDRIAERPGVLTVDFADLDREAVCRSVFEHCLPYAMPAGHFEGLRDRNIQVDFPSLVNYCLAHRGGIEAFKRAAKADLRALARSGRIGRAAR